MYKLSCFHCNLEQIYIEYKNIIIIAFVCVSYVNKSQNLTFYLYFLAQLP